MIRQILITVMVWASFLLPSSDLEAIPLGPGFTYQGQYEQDGAPAAGPANLRFTLWDDVAEGAMIGFDQKVADVPVVDGAFTVVVNAAGEFGLDAFNGDARWLQIEVCADVDCASTTVLVPRQPITAAPYAHHAPGPWKAGQSGGIFTNGPVGIGTDAPDANLQVNDGRIRIRESATTERWDLFYDPPSEKFYFQENAAFNHLVFTKGPDARVGIGTDNPNAKIHVSAPAGSAVLGDSPSGNGVVGTSAAPGFGAIGGTHSGADGIGVYGEANTGSSAYGVYGKSNQGTAVYGTSNIGIGVTGVSTFNLGVKGTSNVGIGVQGVSTQSPGVEGRSASSDGVYGFSDSSYGVRGYSGDDVGVHGESGSAVRSLSSVGVTGIGYNGVRAISNGQLGDALYAEGGFFAGNFQGSVQIIGSLNVTGGISGKSTVSIHIDHPLDPANKYLIHSTVESSEMMNVYSGNAITDSAGLAEVVLPDYFEALNKDFRYQLTVIGDFAQAVVSKEIENNSFEIKTDKPHVKVSWQVTGIRNDAYAKAHPFEVERTKTEEERGKYLAPEVFGQPKEMGIYYRPDGDRLPETASKSE